MIRGQNSGWSQCRSFFTGSHCRSGRGTRYRRRWEWCILTFILTRLASSQGQYIAFVGVREENENCYTRYVELNCIEIHLHVWKKCTGFGHVPLVPPMDPPLFQNPGFASVSRVLRPIPLYTSSLRRLVLTAENKETKLHVHLKRRKTNIKRR